MGIYLSLEDAYYRLMDSLENAGIPVYGKFVTPIESRGVRSFPIAVLCVLAVLAVVFIVFQLLAAAPLKVTVMSANSTPVPGALVMVTWDDVTRAYGNTDKSGKITFTVPAGKTIRVEAEKGEKYAAKALSIGEASSIVLRFQ